MPCLPRAQSRPATKFKTALSSRRVTIQNRGGGRVSSEHSGRTQALPSDVLGGRPASPPQPVPSPHILPALFHTQAIPRKYSSNFPSRKRGLWVQRTCPGCSRWTRPDDKFRQPAAGTVGVGPVARAAPSATLDVPLPPAAWPPPTSSSPSQPQIPVSPFSSPYPPEFHPAPDSISQIPCGFRAGGPCSPALP